MAGKIKQQTKPLIPLTNKSYGPQMLDFDNLFSFSSIYSI